MTMPVPYDASVVLPRYLELLWQRSPGRRGPRPTLSIMGIAEAGVGVADAEGLAAVSMQRVATALGVTPMSLYHYVDSKDELLAIMVDDAIGEPESSPTTPGWRAGLTQWAATLAERRLRHPWSVEVLPARPPLTPHQIGWTELGLEILESTGLSTEERLSVLLAVDGWSQQHVRQCVAMGLVGVPAAGSPPDLYAQHVAELIDPERFPQLALSFGGGAPPGGDYHAHEFERGITLLLDGVEAMVARHGLRTVTVGDIGASSEAAAQ